MIIKKLELTENGVTETFRSDELTVTESIAVVSSGINEDSCLKIMCVGEKPGEDWLVSVLKEITPKRVILCSSEGDYELQLNTGDRVLDKSLVIHFFSLIPMVDKTPQPSVNVKTRLEEDVLYIDEISSCETGENFIEQLIYRWKNIIMGYNSVKDHSVVTPSSDYDLTDDVEILHGLIMVTITRMDELKNQMYGCTSNLGLVKDQEESNKVDWEYVRLMQDEGENQRILNIPLNELAYHIPIAQLRSYFNIKIDDDGVVKLTAKETCKNIFCIRLHDKVIVKSYIKSFFQLYVPRVHSFSARRGVVWNTR